MKLERINTKAGIYCLLYARSVTSLLKECEHLVNILCISCTTPAMGNVPLVAHPTMGVKVTIDSPLVK